MILVAVAAVLAPGGERAAMAAPALLLEAAGEAAIRRMRPVVELALEDGGSAVLAQLAVPAAAEAEARRLLARLLDRAVLDGVGATDIDRYGRTTVTAGAPDGRSPQAALVAAGLALVRPEPGADPVVLADLLAREARAASAGLGIWRQPASWIAGTTPDATAARLGEFVLIEGVVLQASRQQRYFYLNFGADWRTDTSARIDRDTLRGMQRAGFEPQALEGRRVRLRGTLFADNGPMLELWTHHGIEVLE